MKLLGWVPVFLQRDAISPFILTPRKPVSLPTFPMPPAPPAQPRPPMIPKQIKKTLEDSTAITKKSTLLEMLSFPEGKFALVKPHFGPVRVAGPKPDLKAAPDAALESASKLRIETREVTPPTTETPLQNVVAVTEHQELVVPVHDETTLTTQHAEQRAGTPEHDVDAPILPQQEPVVLVPAHPLAAQETVGQGAAAGATDPEVVVPETTAAHQEPEVLLPTSSSLSADLITKITKLSTRLEREIKSHWPYPNKDLKQYKITGLNELIELAKTCSVQDALAQIENKYPKIKDGRMSTRTADLLDEIARFGQQNVLPMPG